MILQPMIGSWEVPRIEHIRAGESRRLSVLPVPGLSGDLHQDLGRGALVVEITGSLTSDEARDGFLEELRRAFYAAEPVDFVADIVHQAELEQVLIEELVVAEVAGTADSFRYRIRLREHTEPPAPGGDLGLGLDADLAAELDAALDLEAELGLDLLDLPAVLGAVPQIGDLLAPVETAVSGVRDALAGAGSLLSPLEEVL